MKSRRQCGEPSLGQAASKGIGVSQNGERGSVGDAELPVNMVQVNLHCALGQPQPPPDFLVGDTVGEHADDLALAGGQLVVGTSS